MKVIIAKDYNEMSRLGALMVEEQIHTKTDSVLGLPTGSTPVGIYQNLVRWAEIGDIDFSKVTTFNLDEYKGIEKDNPQSYHYFMQKHLFQKVKIDPEHITLPDGMTEDGRKECENYEEKIEAAGGIDFMILGLGLNGHIGFNEPSDTFERNVHLVDLEESTREANKRFFGSIEEVPKQAYTMGIGTIMRSKKILLCVNGEKKAAILKQVLEGPVTSSVPASILQFHPDCTLICDREAGRLL